MRSNSPKFIVLLGGFRVFIRRLLSKIFSVKTFQALNSAESPDSPFTDINKYLELHPPVSAAPNFRSLNKLDITDD